MKKLPENILFISETDEVTSHSSSETINALVKKFKVTDYESENPPVKKGARDIVKDFFMLCFNSTDENPATLPEGFEDYEKVFDQVKEYATDHVKATENEKAKKEKEKEQKEQQREADKKAKEAENKKFADAQTKYSDTVVAKADSIGDVGEKLIGTVVKGIKLPSTVSFAKSGMGLNIGDKASVKDIGEASAAVFATLEGQSSLQGALQFIAGDLVNGAVKAGIFRTKNDAQQGIALVLKEKLKKNFAAGSLNQYATMAERIPLESRKFGITPALYLVASKAAMPKLKTAKSEAETKVIEGEFNTLRDELVESINSGDLVAMKDVQAKINEFKTSKGFERVTAGDTKKAIEDNLRKFFFASFAKEYLVGIHPDKEGVAVFEDAPGVYVDVEEGVLMDYIEEAKNNLQNLLIGKQANEILAGKKMDGKKEVPVFMQNPFKVASDEAPAKEEPAKDEKKSSKKAA